MSQELFSQTSSVIKRKYRWTCEANFPAGKLAPHFVKLDHHPIITDPQPSLPIDGLKMFITTFFTMNSEEDVKTFMPLWEIVRSFLTEEDKLKEGTEFTASLGVVTLRLYDGCGTLLETYTCEGVWPKLINFGDLDFSNSGETVVDVTWVYNNCKFESHLPKNVSTDQALPRGIEPL